MSQQDTDRLFNQYVEADTKLRQIRQDLELGSYSYQSQLALVNEAWEKYRLARAAKHEQPP